MNISKSIFVTFQHEGLHHWPEAVHHAGVEFLAHPHRHVFHFRVELSVNHSNREVEFILLKRELESLYREGVLQLDHMSCEMLAEDLLKYLILHYPKRALFVEVSEDGENGALVTHTPALNQHPNQQTQHEHC